MHYGVITEVPPAGSVGNLAAAWALFQAADEPDTYEPVNPLISLSLRVPVFHVGELLVLNDDGRELAYPGRKPAKWDVKCERFDTVQDALARVQEVLEVLG